MAEPWKEVVNKIDDYRWEIPTSYKAGMTVPGLIYSSESMLGQIWEEQVFQQVANVAFLPGIIGHSMAMPDIHWGYGFAIGGVAGTRVRDGVVSPGGVGFDINCGVRLLRTNLTEEEVRPKIKQLVNELFTSVPSGVGSKGKLRVSEKELNQVMVKGSRWAVEKGYGEDERKKWRERYRKKLKARMDLQKRRKNKLTGSGNEYAYDEEINDVYDPEGSAITPVYNTKPEESTNKISPSLRRKIDSYAYRNRYKTTKLKERILSLFTFINPGIFSNAQATS